MSYKLLSSVKVNGSIPVSKYVSSESGIKLYISEVNSPIVNGYFALATEADNDDGLPHTLEHLIFLGSEDYPYKGVLDLLANRCLASGTNAWTETDNTVYTLGCAGSEGFMNLLPIYLDHILFPSLTDAAFMSEVYSVTETGDDNGAVYCEMQGRENSGESRGNLELLRQIYPGSGYSAETGGIMKNLRESTNIEKIRKYHSNYYRPENLCIVIAGQVTLEQVTKAMAPIEAKIAKRKASYPPFVVPWQTPVLPLKESKNVKVLFPSDEEESGLVYIGFLGPKATTDYETLTACCLLLKYLTETSVSPIQQSFIELDEPFASRVNYNISENSTSLLYFTFENVPIDRIDMIYERFIQLMVDIANEKDKLDEERMKIVFEKYILERLSSLENSPHDDIAYHIFGDVLFGKTSEDFDKRLNVYDIVNKLQSYELSYWTDLLRKYFIDNNNVVVRAYPSIAEKEKLAKEEVERLQLRRDELGEEGLLKKGVELDDAMEINDRPPPLEMLVSVPVPSTKSISFHKMEVLKKEDKMPVGSALDFEKLPFYLEIFNMKTNFVYITAAFDSSKLPTELRNYMLLFLDLILESPVKLESGELLPYEAVVSALESNTIAYETSLGLQSASRFGCGPFSNTWTMSIQAETRKFEEATSWLTNLIFNSVFTQDRIHINASKMVNDIATAKRNGYDMAKELMKAIYYKKDTNVALNSVLTQHTFLNDIVEKLKNEESAKKIIDDLNQLRILMLPTMTVHLALNLELTKDIKTPMASLIEKFTKLNKAPLEKLPVTFDSSLMIAEGTLDAGNTGTIVGIGCVESGYLFQSSPGVTSFMDPDLPAILLHLQYLSQLEGPMWKKIRKNSYGYNVIPKPNEGIIVFSLYRATNLFDAFKDAKTIVEAQLKPDSKFDQTLLESAKSSLIFEIIDREKTIGDLVSQAMLNSFKGVTTEYNKLLVERVANVSVNDLRRVGKKYFTNMFSKDAAKLVIVCHPDKVDAVSEQFKEFGHNLKMSSSLESSLLSGCN